MSRIARLAVVVLSAAACAVAPAMAQAATGHGNRCGKGHTKHSRALGKSCVKKQRKAAKRRDYAAAKTVSAAVVKKCRDELAADEIAFQAKYANAAGREALGRCIRLNAEDAPAPDPAQKGDIATAAQTCAAEKAVDPAAFVVTYADENGREAFGSCVRQHAQDSGDDSADNTTDAPAADEQSDKPVEDDSAGVDDGSGDGGAIEAIPGLDSLFF